MSTQIAGFIERGWLDRLLVAVPRASNILVLGCGSGEPIARYLIDKGHKVTGIDPAAQSIALAHTRFPRHNWLHGDIDSSAVSGLYRGILAWDCLHTAADQRLILENAARWLEPGGALLFDTRGDALPPQQIRALFAEAGLLEIAHAPSDPATNGTSIWLARKRIS